MPHAGHGCRLRDAALLRHRAILISLRRAPTTVARAASRSRGGGDVTRWERCLDAKERLRECGEALLLTAQRAGRNALALQPHEQRVQQSLGALHVPPRLPELSQGGPIRGV